VRFHRFRSVEEKMKVTVIGGSGFIGTYLCQHFADLGIPFEILDLKPSKRFPEATTIVDIRDYASLFDAVTGDIIVHLAAVHRDDVRDRKLYYETNVEGTRNICRLAEEKAIHQIVFTSTVAVYGFAPANTDENGQIAPFNDYGKSKFQGENELRAWRDANPEANSLSILRPTVVFGKGNRGNVYNLLNFIQTGNFVMVGSGKNRKSMAYVENIAAFIAHVSFAPDVAYKVYNYVDKPDLDMNALVFQVREKLKGKSGIGIRVPYPLGLAVGALADVFATLTGKTLPVSYIRIKKFCGTTAFGSCAHEAEGFKAPKTLQQGLDATLEAEFINPDPDMEVFFTE